MPLASTNCVGAVWWLFWFIGIPSGGGAQADLRNGRKRAASRLSEATSSGKTAGRGTNLRARTGSVDGFTAVDVEDMAGDERSFVRGDEDDGAGKLLREAEATHRNSRHKSRLVLRRARKAG